MVESHNVGVGNASVENPDNDLDSTVDSAVKRDLEWAYKITGRGMSSGGRTTSRWLEIRCSQGNAYKRPLVPELLFVKSHSSSRSSTVWVAFEEASTDMYAIKDSWRPFTRISEMCYLEDLKERFSRAVELESIPGLTIDCDRLKPESSQHKYAVPPFTCSLTKSIGVGDEGTPNECCCTHLVTSPVLRPISEFRSTSMMVTAIRSAILGHKNAAQIGLLHSDISSGTVMMVDVEHKRGPGLLFDFDNSFLRELDSNGVFKDVSTQSNYDGDTGLQKRPGALDFMAISLLRQSNGVQHTAAYDLESFYWLLVWMVLRHTNHDQGSSMYAEIFPNSTQQHRRAVKTEWIGMDGRCATIHDNDPLTWLLREWSTLYTKQYYLEPEFAIPVRHDDVLRLLDEALAKDGWPGGDAAVGLEVPEDAT